MYIGQKQIQTVTEKEDGIVNVLFVDGTDQDMKLDRLNIVSTKDAYGGSELDILRFILSRQFFKEMAEKGLTFMEASHVVHGIEAIMDNMRSMSIGKRFGCKNDTDIKLSSIYDDVSEYLDDDDSEKPVEV